MYLGERAPLRPQCRSDTGHQCSQSGILNHSEHKILMPNSMRFRTILLFSTLWAGPAALARADFVVVPNAYANVQGTIGVGTILRDQPRTLQVVYSASQFASVPLGSRITAVAFRLEAGQATYPPTDRHYDGYSIQLSQSLNAPGSLSGTFAENIGADVVTVRSGPLDIAPLSINGGPGINPFDFVLSFTTPYIYEGGDLLMTLRESGNGVDFEFVDAVANDSIGQAIAAIGDTATDNSSLNIDSYPIAQFTYTGGSVPEPSSYVLLCAGVIGLLGSLQLRGKGIGPDHRARSGSSRRIGGRNGRDSSLGR
jgi:hypothetical protein